MRRRLNILFLGAAKRVSLLERFLAAAERLDVHITIHSFEKDNGFCPISHLALVHGAPKFSAAAFQDRLTSFIAESNIHIVIPNMDAATEALAIFRETRASPGCWNVISKFNLVQAMHAKDLAAVFFQKHHLPTPVDTPGRFPKIVKPVHGFGGKGIKRVASSEELAAALVAKEPMLVQDFVDGIETTADFYVSPRYGLLGYVLRDRIEVSDGEVMICKTREPTASERDLLERIAAIPGWEGCITVQYIRAHERAPPCLIEINPRFGGGATASIEAGLDMAYYVLGEYLGLPLSPAEHIRTLLMSRARRDFFLDLPVAEGLSA